MAGYQFDYSMSNNARAAYSNGEKPWSKWKRRDIINYVGPEVIARNNKLKNLSTAEMKAIFLTETAWHHTSKFYNRTTFYACRDLQDIRENPDDTIDDLYNNPPYPHPVAHVFASINSPEATKFYADFEEWKKKMKRLENIIQAIADGLIQ